MREHLFGFDDAVPSDPVLRRRHLCSLGLSSDVAENIERSVRVHGPILSRWGVPLEVVTLLRNLHAGAWFKVADLETAISSRLGGRQGCKVGALIFNSIYSESIRELHGAMDRLGMSLWLPQATAAFWGEAPELCSAEIPVRDCTFVDDECIFVVKRTACQVQHCAPALIRILSTVFNSFGLNLNWNPGKTEGMLSMRGKHAHRHLLSLLVDGKPSLPGGDPGTVLRLVREYKHLGLVVSVDRSVVNDARKREKDALTSYTPLAARIFGSPVVHVWTKLALMQSLVMSRLLFNAHVLVPTRSWIKRIGSVQMRVLRRIFGDPLVAKPRFSNMRLREQAGWPSVDCLLVRARLKYLRRLLNNRPEELLAVLAWRGRRGPPPWVELIVDDMRCFAQSVLQNKPWLLGDPEAEPLKWSRFIVGMDHDWDMLVDELFFFSSLADKELEAPLSEDHHAKQWVCTFCPTHPRFPSEKAMLQHQRIAHGKQCEARRFVGGTECQICGIRFATRLRCIAHLSDKRRTKCSSKLYLLEPLPDAEIARLDAEAEEARSVARKSGCTVPRAGAQAFRSDGRPVGRPKL